MIKRSFRHFVLALLGVIPALFPDPAPGADLNSALNLIVTEIRAEVLERDLKSVRIGRIENPHSSAGRRIESELKRLLLAAKVPIVDEEESEAELRGKLDHFDVGEYVAATLNTGLYAGDGQELETYRRRLDAATRQSRSDLNSDLAGFQTADAISSVDSGVVIDDAQDVALLHGATVDVVQSVQKATGLELAPRRTGEFNPTKVSVRPQSQRQARVAVDRSIRDAVIHPSFYLSEMSHVSSAAESPFRIELLATPPYADHPYTPVALVDRDGLAYADLRAGQRYAIRIHNDAPFDVGVELSIDGINSLALSEVESYRRIGKWIVSAGKTGLVQGWQTERGAVAKFLVTSQYQSVAATLGRPQGIGMVTAAFFPAWTGDDPPAYERLVAGSTRQIATGRGPIMEVADRSDIRSYGTEPLSIVSVRYENPNSTTGLAR